MELTRWDTEYFGGIEGHVNVISHHMPFNDI
jgi:hypothetical protein